MSTYIADHENKAGGKISTKTNISVKQSLITSVTYFPTWEKELSQVKA